jgi:hypothetical protein
MNPATNVLLSSPWPGMVIWVALYISDYALTLKCARLYRRAASEKIELEGSFEITPYYQNDVDALRTISPRFLTALVLSVMYLAVLWWLALATQPAFYEFVIGMLVSTELAVHHRHIRNLFLFRALANSDAVQGRIRYARPLLLRMSAVEMLAFSGLFAVLFVFTWSWFVLGGVLGCVAVAFKHLRLARKQVANATTKPAAPPPMEAEAQAELARR